MTMCSECNKVPATCLIFSLVTVLKFNRESSSGRNPVLQNDSGVLCDACLVHRFEPLRELFGVNPVDATSPGREGA